MIKFLCFVSILFLGWVSTTTHEPKTLLVILAAQAAILTLQIMTVIRKD